jgi:hypothetical protein
MFIQAKLVHSQRELEEFAVTEIGKSHKPLQELHQPPQSSFAVFEGTCNESSFLPFHDSMLTSASFRKPVDRKPLQELHHSHQVSQPPQSSFGVFEDTCNESSFLPFHDSMQSSASFKKAVDRKPLQELHHSHQMSQHSFGVYQNTCNESSFLPFHDSMQTSSCSTTMPDNPRHYSAPLGAPIVHYDQALSEQTFTQFDIAHPKSTDSVSTPRIVSRPRGICLELA